MKFNFCFWLSVLGKFFYKSIKRFFRYVSLFGCFVVKLAERDNIVIIKPPVIVLCYAGNMMGFQVGKVQLRYCVI